MSPEELADLRWLAAEVEIHGENNVIVYTHKNGVPNGLFALHWISKLLVHIDSLTAQIATWKDVATGERAKLIAEAKSGDFVDANGDHMLRIMSVEDCMTEASKQLEAEYPEAMR